MRLSLSAAAALLTLSTLSAQSNLFVELTGSDATGDGSMGNPYRTIAFAVSQAFPNDVIKVGAGDFDDPQILLGARNLTIQGSGMGVTTIRPPMSGVMLNAGFLPGSATTYVAGIAVVGTRNIVIEDLTIDGSNRMPGTGRLVGVFVGGGADVTIDHVEIVGCRAAPLDGNQRPAGVIIRGDNMGDPTQVYLRESKISDWGKAGVAAFFNADVRMEYCEVFGAGSTNLLAQNCVQLGYDATGTLSFNTIGDAAYTGGGFDATGVLLYDAGSGSEIFANNVVRCDEGLSFVSTAIDNIGTKVQSNRVTAANSRPVRATNARGLTITRNRFHGVNASVQGAFDNATSGNIYSQNSFSDYNGFGSYLVDGGPQKDLQPSDGVIELDGASDGIGLSGLPKDVLIADLDGDFQLDFAAVTVNASLAPALQIGLENGAGSYATTATGFASNAADPVRIVAGEFNGQAGIDVAVITANNAPAQNQNRVYVFRNNGSGGFAFLSVTNLVGAFDPSDVAAADLDFDGVDDLAISFLGNNSLSGGGTVLLNDGVGTTFTQSLLPGVTDRCSGIAIGDLVTGDPDIALASGDDTSGTTYVFENDGTGAFTLSTSFASTDFPRDADLLDVDEDGDLDILVAGLPGADAFASGEVTVGINLGGTFAPQSLTIDRDPVKVLVADLDNDDDADTRRRDAVVVTRGGNGFTVLGGFQDGMPTVGGIAVLRDLNGTTIIPQSGALGDLNGDGFTDLLGANAFANELRWSRGQPSSRADLFGFACKGERGQRPQISVVGNPPTATIPNPTFTFEVSNGRPSTFGALLIGIQAFPTLAPCTVQVDPVVISQTVITNNMGTGSLLVGVPNDPSLFGGDLLKAQFLLLDPAGGFLASGSMSRALRVRIGAL